VDDGGHGVGIQHAPGQAGALDIPHTYAAQMAESPPIRRRPPVGGHVSAVISSSDRVRFRLGVNLMRWKRTNRCPVLHGVVAGLVLLLSSCSSPTDVSAAFDITLTGDGDGCGIPGWTIAPEAARLVLSGTDSDLTVAVAPAPETGPSILRDLIASGILTGTGVASDFEVEALSDTAVGPCDSQIRVTMTATEEAGTLLGTITYEPVSSCAELTGCSAVQVFSGSRSE